MEVMVAPEGVDEDSKLAKRIMAGDKYSSSLLLKDMKAKGH